MSAASSRAKTSSMKGGMRLHSGASSRHVRVRGFENLAHGDSTLFRPDSSSGEAPVRAPSTDELYLAAARAATRQLQVQNSLVLEGPRRPVRTGREPFREGSARVAGLLDPYPEAHSPSKNAPGALSAPSDPSTPPSVLTHANSSNSETSSVGDASPERRSTETAPARPPLPPRLLVDPKPAAVAVAPAAAAAAPAASATPPPPSAPRAYAGEFVKLEDHDRSMAMASLALVAKNIAIDAITVETDHLRREVVALSPKAPLPEPHEHSGSAEASGAASAKPEPVPEASAEASSSSSELEAARAEIARLRAELDAERNACFTLRAERVAWRAERAELMEERARLADGAASSARCLNGDAETVAHETLRTLSFALRGEDLSYDAPAVRRRAEAVAEAGGVSAVLGAMAAHRDSERVQAVGSEALRRMVESSDAARRLLLSEPEALVGGGGVPVLVGAMRAHADSEDVAEAAGGALVTMAKNDRGKAREAIAEVGGREAILEAASKHPEVSYGEDVAGGDLYGWLVSSF